MIWVIWCFVIGGFLYLGLGIWAAAKKRDDSSDFFLGGSVDLMSLAIWPIALPFIIKEMFSDLPGTESDVPEVKEVDAMPGSKGVASTDLRPSGRVVIGGKELEAIATDGMIFQGTQVEVVDRDDLRILVRVYIPGSR